MQMQERGYGRNEKRVCEDCLGNRFGQIYAEYEVEDEKCDFCDNIGIKTTIEDLCGEIKKVVETRYHQVDGYPPGMKSDPYFGPPYWDTYDLFHEVLAPELELSDKVLEEVINTFEVDGFWGEINPSE